MPLVQVPGMGNVSFPDGMSEDEMLSAIDGHFTDVATAGLQTATALPGEILGILEAGAEPSADARQQLERDRRYPFPSTFVPGSIPPEYLEPQAELLNKGLELAGKGILQVANLPTTLANRGKTPDQYGYVPRLEELPRPKLPRLTSTDVPSGLINAAEEAVEGLVPPFAPPEVALTLPLLGGEGAASRGIMSLLGAQQLMNIPPQLREAVAILQDPNASPAAKTEAFARPGVAALFGGLMMGHAARTPPPAPFVGPLATGEALQLPPGAAPRPRAEMPAAAPDLEQLGIRFGRTEPQGQPPVVPATPPEPERGMTAIEEIRAKNARTKEQIRRLYPQLSREQAAQLRDQVWGKQPAPAPAEAPEPIQEIENARGLREDERQIPPGGAEPQGGEGKGGADLEREAQGQTGSRALAQGLTPEDLEDALRTIAQEGAGEDEPAVQVKPTQTPETPIAPQVKPAQAAPLGPTMESARAIADMSPDEFAQRAASFNKINLELGRNATPEQIAELRQLAAKARERFQAAKKKALETRAEADLDAMAKLSSMPQFYNEAIAAYEQAHPKAPEPAPAPEAPKPAPKQPGMYSALYLPHSDNVVFYDHTGTDIGALNWSSKQGFHWKYGKEDPRIHQLIAAYLEGRTEPGNANIDLRGKAAEAIPAPEAPKESGFKPPAAPETFKTVQDFLKYRDAYRQAELDFYKSLGLSEKDATKLLRASDNRSQLDVSAIEEKLTPENRQRLELFSTGEGAQMYQWDRQFDPSQLESETSPQELAKALVANLSRESLPTEVGDKLTHAAIALRKLKENGGTWSDVAKALDQLTTRESGSQGDKAAVFKTWGQKIRQFAQQQGIELSEGNLGKSAAPKSEQYLGPGDINPPKFQTGAKVLAGQGGMRREGEIAGTGPKRPGEEQTYFVKTNLGEVLYKESDLSLPENEPAKPAEAPAQPAPPPPPPAPPAPPPQTVEEAKAQTPPAAERKPFHWVAPTTEEVKAAEKALGEALVAYEKDKTRANWEAAQAAKLNLSRLQDAASPGLQRAQAEAAPFRSPAAQAAVPKGTQTIPPKVLKGQKDNLLQQLAEAIKNAPEQGREDDKITIEVPGDGTWTLINDRQTLKNFAETVRKRFPSTTGSAAMPKLPSGKAAAMAKVGPPKSDELPKLAGGFVSDDPSREVIQTSYADGTQIVATNGRQLIRIVTDQAPGSPDKPVRLDAKGAPDKEAAGTKYPNWKQIGDPKADLVYGGLDTGQVWHIAKQALVFIKTSPEQRFTPGLDLVVNPDRSIGGKMTIVGEEFSHNVQEGALRLGKYNPNYLADGMDLARRLGNDKVDVFAHSGDDGPIGFVGQNHEQLIMPMREENISVRDDSPKFNRVAGQAVHSRLPEGFGPFQDPDSFLAEYTEHQGKKYRTELQAGTVTFNEVNTHKGYGRNPDTTSVDEVGKLKLADLPSNSKAQRKAIAAVLGKEVKADSPLVTALRIDVENLIHQREKLLEEAKTRKAWAEQGNISEGPGAASPGDVPRGSQLSQLTAAIRAQRISPAQPIGERINDALRLADRWAEGKDAVTKSLARARAASLALIEEYRTGSLPKWTDFRSALGRWIGADNITAWEVRQFLKQINREVPQRIRQEAITNWIFSGGDEALLSQRAEASGPSVRRGYEVATRLTEGEKTLARNIQSYLESRLQEGIQAGLLKQGVDNYITQIWKQPNQATQRLWHDLFGANNLNPSFKFARRRVFDSYFTGEQAGFVPRDKRVGTLISAYDLAFNRAISARNFLLQMHGDAEKGIPAALASDGAPLVMLSGKTIPVPAGADVPEAFLIKPHAKPAAAVTPDGRPYEVVDHWALRDWKWATTGADGQPVLLQSDMLVHPEAADHLRNALTRSRLQQIPVFRQFLQAGALAKQTKLSLSPFHMTQEGVHAAAHRVNPLKQAMGALKDSEIDINDPLTRRLVDHGLIIADPRLSELFSEGMSGGGLVSKVPGLGHLQVWFNDMLFKDFIPRLKIQMAREAWERNRNAYAGELARGKITEDQLLALTAREANAAFGEQNYRLMGRSPFLQDIFRLIMLAPDFLESRARFVGQALKPYGREQRIALAIMGGTLYVGSRVLNQALDGDPHWNRPFSLVIKGREYKLRTLLGDVQHLITDPRSFWYNRMSPFLRTASEYVTGRDDRGIKRSSMEELKDLAAWFLPISLQSRSDQTHLESALTSAGFSVRQYGAQQQLFPILDKWRSKQTDPRVKEAYERQRQETHIDSVYTPLRHALLKGDQGQAKREYQKLLQSRTAGRIFTAMRATKPVTGSWAAETRFLSSLTPEQRKIYERARQERAEVYQRFLKAIAAP